MHKLRAQHFFSVFLASRAAHVETALDAGARGDEQLNFEFQPSELCGLHLFCLDFDGKLVTHCDLDRRKYHLEGRIKYSECSEEFRVEMGEKS